MKPGLVTIGGGGIGTLDFKNERTIWDNRGTIVFSGRADFGKGSRISVDERGVLEIGAGFHLSGRSSIICNHRIVLGNDLLLSWDILIMDSDFHPIKPKDSNDVINNPKEIVIGNHVWIGCRSMILKGVTICDNVVLAAGSVITRSIETPDCVVTSTGGPIQVIKEHITWDEQ